ncbi:GNAT family N-acetyltransferase [Blastococcus sp. TML/M2B]|uniref:GNAT family N-acetyltransferase n=1 Tax=unclassified Blastococcus TaxID=2619396 RepID=UPI00190E54BD|nr:MULTISPECIES: GNAT family N-acetyltransferase [unclassified Blastococcus]MBN1092479.1 GNAT family N-acetyltransferase [Blastococcus sp. TML/M2B]MBN1097427.1 GNAT family N-acetyltransferase [Blastococcus sp. TML/C7B]
MVTRVARPEDLPVVLDLVRQHRSEAHAEEVLTGHPPVHAAGAGFRRLLEDGGHQVVLAVLPGADGCPETGVAVGLAVLGLDPLSLVLGTPQVTVDTFVVHRDHRRSGVGAALLAAAAGYARANGAAHVVAAVAQEADRQRFFARMGFAPLTTRRIASVHTLGRSLAAWQRRRLGILPLPRRVPAMARRRGVPPLPSAPAGR